MTIIYRKELNRSITADEVDGNFRYLVDKIEALEKLNAGLRGELDEIMIRIKDAATSPITEAVVASDNVQYIVQFIDNKFYLSSKTNQIEITPMLYNLDSETLHIGVDDIKYYRLTSLKDKI